MLDAVDGKAGIVVGKSGSVRAQVLLPLGAVVPELGKIAVDGRIVDRQDDVGVGIASKTRGGDFFSGQAPADLVPSLEDSDAHATVFHQIHGEEQSLVPAADDHRIKGLVRHCSSFFNVLDL